MLPSVEADFLSTLFRKERVTFSISCRMELPYISLHIAPITLPFSFPVLSQAFLL